MKKLKDYIILLFFPVSFLLTGLIMESPRKLGLDLIKIIVEKDILLTDYLEVGGIAGTFINAGLVSLFAIYLIYKSDKEIDGITIAAVYTIMGFSFIGKNILNVLPIYLGGYIYSRYNGSKMKDSIVALIFSTTLAPVVGEIIFGFGLNFKLSIPLGILMGVFIGFIVSPLGNHMLSFHKGYNLYNIGFTGGIIATVITSVFRNFGLAMETQYLISLNHTRFLSIYLVLHFIAFIAYGLVKNKDLASFKKLLGHPGRKADFKGEFGIHNTLLNMGIMGIVALVYVFLSAGEISGPVVAGILTVVGFAASGKHIKNTLPVLLGVYLTASLNIMDISSPSVIMAGLFGTTLAPIAGEYGFLAGMVCGFLHIGVGSNILKGHGGLNLYNNGFSGGIVAAFMLPILETIRARRSRKDFKIF